MTTINLINQFNETTNANLVDLLTLIQNNPKLLILFVAMFILALFDFIMKAVAMYRAGTRKEVARFICLLIFNTCGILPIIYLATHKKID